MRSIVIVATMCLWCAGAQAMTGKDYIDLYEQYRLQVSDESMPANLTFYILGLSDMSVAALNAQMQVNPDAAAEKDKYADCLSRISGGKAPVDPFYDWLKARPESHQDGGGALWTVFVRDVCGVSTALQPSLP